MVTLPKLIEPGVTPRVPLVVVAVPLRGTATDASVAFEAMVRLAVLVPGLVGEYVTDKLALAPAARDKGKASPVKVKLLPVTVAAEIVRLAVPVFDKVSACVWLLPTATLPKLMDPGLTPRVPLVAVAVPLSETITDGSDAFDAMARLAVFVPELVGENLTDRFAVEPAARE